MNNWRQSHHWSFKDEVFMVLPVMHLLPRRSLGAWDFGVSTESFSAPLEF